MDDRRYCVECSNLSPGGFCRAGSKVALTARYHPLDDIPRRCSEFSPNGTVDPRHGEQKILAWLESIGETDLEIIQETLDRCRADKKTREFFLRQWRLAFH